MADRGCQVAFYEIAGLSLSQKFQILSFLKSGIILIYGLNRGILSILKFNLGDFLSMIDAYKKYWKQYADFSGRSTRSDYWWVVLCNFLITLPIGFLLGISLISGLIRLGLKTEEYGYAYTPTPDDIFAIFSPFTILLLLLLFIFYLAVLVPNLAISVRRLRDGGFHWAFIFLLAPSILTFVPLMWIFVFPCQIAFLVLMCMPTKVQNPAFNGQGPVNGYYQQPQAPQPGQFNQQAPVQPQAPQTGQFNNQAPVQPQAPVQEQPNQFQQTPQASVQEQPATESAVTFEDVDHSQETATDNSATDQ